MNQVLRLNIFTRYANKGASSRLRCLQYIEPLFQSFQITVNELLKDDYINHLYHQNNYSFLKIFSNYLKRILDLFKCTKNDVLWIEKELFPYLPYWFEKLFLYNKKYVIDLDDAWFLRYNENPNRIIRFICKNKLEKLVHNASHFIAGNEFLANWGRNCGAKKIIILPTSVDINKYQSKADTEKSNFVIGWIGTPATQKYLLMLKDVLAKLHENASFELWLVGANKVELPNINVKYIAWDEATEQDIIRQFDVGIMPLENTLWEQGKCGYKIIQYFACGVPAIASNVGANKDIIQNGFNGYLAENDADWLASLIELKEEQSLRKELGINARITVEKKYNKHIIAEKLREIFNSL